MQCTIFFYIVRGAHKIAIAIRYFLLLILCLTQFVIHRRWVIGFFYLLEIILSRHIRFTYRTRSVIRAEVSKLKNKFVKRRIPPPQWKTLILIYIKLIFMKRILYTSTYTIDCRHIIIIWISPCVNTELITSPFHILKCIFDT